VIIKKKKKKRKKEKKKEKEKKKKKGKKKKKREREKKKKPRSNNPKASNDLIISATLCNPRLMPPAACSSLGISLLLGRRNMM